MASPHLHHGDLTATSIEVNFSLVAFASQFYNTAPRRFFIGQCALVEASTGDGEALIAFGVGIHEAFNDISVDRQISGCFPRPAGTDQRGRPTMKGYFRSLSLSSGVCSNDD